MVYLDHNATSPPHPRVLEEALPLLTEHWGNPSSSHSMARRPMAAVEIARRRLAEWGGVRPRDVVFTGGATEANNLAVLGVDRPGRLFSAIEHPSVAAASQAAGGQVILIMELTFVAPDHRKDKIHKFGHIHLDDIIERREMFKNQVVIASHFSTRYQTRQIRRTVERRLPDMLDGRLKLWL